MHCRSRPARALWIEMLCQVIFGILVLSRPARALWIEMSIGTALIHPWGVEAREGLVD